MNTQYKTIRITVILFCFICSTQLIYAQAKNALGAGPALNSSKFGGGFGGVLQGEIKFTRKAALVPSIGVEAPYTGYISLAGKYYFQPGIHVNLGAFLHIGGDDASDSGPGGTAGIGYEMVSSKRHILDLDFHLDVMQIERETAPIGGLRLTYNFSFSKRD